MSPYLCNLNLLCPVTGVMQSVILTHYTTPMTALLVIGSTIVLKLSSASFDPSRLLNTADVFLYEAELLKSIG